MKSECILADYSNFQKTKINYSAPFGGVSQRLKVELDSKLALLWKAISFFAKLLQQFFLKAYIFI